MYKAHFVWSDWHTFCQLTITNTRNSDVVIITGQEGKRIFANIMESARRMGRTIETSEDDSGRSVIIVKWDYVKVLLSDDKGNESIVEYLTVGEAVDAYGKDFEALYYDDVLAVTRCYPGYTVKMVYVK